MTNKQAILHLKSACPRLSHLIDEIGELDIREHTDSFLFLVREIVGQMVSAAVKRAMFERLTALCDGEITAERIITHTTDELRAIGLSRTKSEAILGLAQKVTAGEMDFDRL